MAWKTRRLAELCEIKIGRTPARNEPAYWGEGWPWLSIADMNQGRILMRTKEQISQFAAESLMGAPIPPGTVVLSFKLSIGKVGITKVPMYSNEAIAALHIKDPRLITSNFLYWALQTIPLTVETDDAVMGKTLNKAKLARLEVPVPSLYEQDRIVEALDQADKLRAKRQEAIALLDDLIESVFLDMFGTPTDGWELRTVEEVAAPVRGSIRTGPFGSQLLHEEFVNSGIAVLGIDNAVTNEFRWGERRYITEQKYKQLSRYTVHPGDVLITIMGTCGRCAIVPEDIPIAINTKHLCCITLDQSKCLPEFLHSYFLRHPSAQSYLRKTAKGAIMSGLNMAIIKGLPIHLPPLDLQQKFAVKLRAIHEAKTRHIAHAAELDTLFASLQQRAFRGDLWDNQDN
ncbi:restriction endonuclease subunit S [Microbispora sp. KK1-11]|uniref:restriction endonuclease subunit S n=1 Tax=Microbispora sp. KK1-11 TaxID=2053005 RepID=UPI001159D2C1|nr:restriction endonuclease subunit S [Microbispora sp. KK1-11]TQS30472.1 restriction endonuclease subunit S [Microbispora sp. KK1-11]